MTIDLDAEVRIIGPCGVREQAEALRWLGGDDIHYRSWRDYHTFASPSSKRILIFLADGSCHRLNDNRRAGSQ